MKPHYAGDDVTLYLGDALAVLREMPDASVDCCVTSPPYFGLRDYGIEGQYGLEASPAEYVETVRALFAEVRRVLAADGTLWLNIGDSVLTWAIALARRGVLPDEPPKRHWWRELVTTHWRDAHDQWLKHAEAASNGWATELAEFRTTNPPPTLKAFMVGLSRGSVQPGLEPEKVA